ncbi:helix-turn-helix domain-containing protein [Peptoniphilaceae bacterium SGI.137]|nr:helix-turn-helix domain-containing protein [Peptoniphilaceae bacterium]MDY4196445.1 helix-turn-helix transcriptional regulator [Peptoniphilaceae bacterium]MDY5842766.1 helix-turn-helix transcriptional regulator [Peptoniphilaceae bacterium]MDY6147137.1 helix-turn-helix transcriptional regulator [Peptoniphilaceae bacterium]
MNRFSESSSIKHADLLPEASEDIFQALMDARIDCGMTQRELADRIGMTQGDISKIEHGNANPSVKTLQRLADGLGMTLKLSFLPQGKKSEED